MRLLLLPLVLVLSPHSAIAQADSADPLGGDALATVGASQVIRLAETGRFSDLLRRLQADFADAPADAHTQSLIDDLSRFHVNASEYAAKRQEAFNSKLDKLTEALDAQKLDEALILAIEAHGLSDEPEAVFAHPAVVDAVAKARAHAKASEAASDWVEAASIYRLLNLLYEEQDGYEEDLKRVSLRLQMLGLYAPKVLDALYEERAKRNGDGEPDAQPQEQIEPDDWTVRLRGVDQKMLDQALLWSARKHVDGGGYKPMVRGAVERLRLFAQTPGLEQTFASMADPVKLKTFTDHLDRTAARLEDPHLQIERIEASTITEGILAANDATLKLPENVLIYEMGEGAMGTLDDFSSIIWPEELESFSRSTQGAFSGVGIQLSRRDGRLVVVSPLENTPAQKAGVKSGDIITAVNEKPTASWTLNRAVNEITGPEGSEVTLAIERGTENLTFTLKRARIIIESIRGWEHRAAPDGGGWDYWIDQKAGIGYVRLSQFIPQTAGDLDAAVAQMQEVQPIRGLILDMRFNPGGRLDSSVEVVDRFVAEGPIVSIVDGDGNKTSTERARKFRTYEDFPVIVLVNQGSASASEIVAGALQDYGRAMVVGNRSFGKGSVQDLYGLDNYKARLKLTRQYYMLPLGRIIHRKQNAKEWGIEPDLTVSVTNEQIAEALQLRQDADILRDAPPAAADLPEGQAPPTTAATILARGVDPQLEAAVLILKTRQLAGRILAGDPNAQQALLNDK